MGEPVPGRAQPQGKLPFPALLLSTPVSSSNIDHLVFTTRRADLLTGCMPSLQGLEDAIDLSVTHPTWQRTKPNDPNDEHTG